MIKNLKILILFLFVSAGIVNAQNVFHYTFSVRGEPREGVLIYEKALDQAVYADLYTTMKANNKVVDETGFIPKDASAVLKARTGGGDRYYYKNGSKVKYTENLLKINYFIDDYSMKIEWNLTDDTKTINELVCKKATTNFRGRNWEVWYTPNIPMYYGPWKFYGLPGLIVSAIDESKEFFFTLNKIENQEGVKMPIVKVSDFKQVNMKKYNDIMEEVFSGEAFNKDKDFKVTVSKVTRGIELRYEWEEI